MIMRFTTFFAAAAIVILDVVTCAPQSAVTTSSEALEKIQASALPDGVVLTGTTEHIDPPTSATAVATKESDILEGQHDDNSHNHKENDNGNDNDNDNNNNTNNNNTNNTNDDDEKKEGFGWGRGGWGNWGGWGGWGGYGPYRFGFTCGGLPGWAYPLGYWNTIGAGLYGGGCSLGIPFGGLYYC